MSSELLATLLFFLQPILPLLFGGFLCGLGTLPRFLLERRFGFRDLLQATFAARHLAGQIVATVSFAVQRIFGRVGFFRQRQQPFHFRPQLFLFLLHAVVAHRFVLAGVGLKLCPVDGYMPQLHQSRSVAELKHLREHLPQHWQVQPTKIGNGVVIRMLVRAKVAKRYVVVAGTFDPS